MPDRPRTDPGVRNYRTGLLKVTRFAHEASLGIGYSEVMAYARSFEPEDLDQLRTSLPILAALLTAAVELAKEDASDVMVEVFESVEVPADSVVLVVPRSLEFRCPKRTALGSRQCVRHHSWRARPDGGPPGTRSRVCYHRPCVPGVHRRPRLTSNVRTWFLPTKKRE